MRQSDHVMNSQVSKCSALRYGFWCFDFFEVWWHYADIVYLKVMSLQDVFQYIPPACCLFQIFPASFFKSATSHPLAPSCNRRCTTMMGNFKALEFVLKSLGSEGTLPLQDSGIPFWWLFGISAVKSISPFLPEKQDHSRSNEITTRLWHCKRRSLDP